MYKGYIYKYTSPSGKIYIGQTTGSLDYRAGKDGIKYRSNGNGLFWKAIQKYGFSNMKSEIISEVSAKSKQELIDALNMLETEAIEKENSTDTNIGYNLTSGGNNYIISDFARARISAKMLGRRLSDSHRESLRREATRRWTEGIFTKERNQKISIANKGKKKSPLHTKNISIGRLKAIRDNPVKFEYLKSPWNKGDGSYMTGNKNHFYGKKHTEETKRKISASRIKYQINLEEVKKFKDEGLSYEKISAIIGVESSTIRKRYKQKYETNN